MNSLRHFPLGAPYPESPHAVASSLPTMRDVCGYEEKLPEVVDVMTSGYPRFVVNSLVQRLIAYYIEREALAGRDGVLVASRRAAQDLIDYVGGDCLSWAVEDDLYLIHFNAADRDQASAVGKYLQHVGCGISSRQAEDVLHQYGQLESTFAENEFAGHALTEVETQLAKLMGARREDVLVCACGMNAVFAAYRSVQEFQRTRGRKRWLQLGWVYLDTGCILKGFMRDGETLDCCYDVNDTDELIHLIESAGDELAGVVVECPTNPLVQICDLPRVATAVRQVGGVLIVDPTIASIYNMDVLSYADVLVCSLTKYACHEGDVMIGALAVNPQSPFYGDLILRASRYYVPPYRRDLSRLACEMESAPTLVAQMNQNAAQLADFMRGHSAVKRVYFSNDSKSFPQLSKSEASTGCVLSIELTGSLEKFYDSIRTMKGPSFGTQFTILSPFMYLAHYDLVTTESGCDYLMGAGIDPDLVRISVGAEPYTEIEAVFAGALNASVVV